MAIQRLAEHPPIPGTNAGISVGFHASKMGSTMTEALASGTAFVGEADTVPAHPVALPGRDRRAHDRGPRLSSRPSRP